MTWDFSENGEQITISSDDTYSGGEKPPQEERLIRKIIGLPITKQLVYYKNKLDSSSVVDITTYKVIKMFDGINRWFVVEVTTEEGNSISIHSSFLSEMQQPSFVADMKAQQRKVK